MTAESRHVSPHYLFAVLNFNGGFGPKDMPGYSLGQLVQRISVHFRLYLASRQENVLCIYLNLNNAFGLKVFDSSNSQEYPITSPEDEFGIRKGLTGLAEEIPEHSAGNGLSACLSLLLCEFNRYRQTSPRLTSSVLILNQCIVPSSQYITFLNATFQAQNSKIRVDAVDMNGSDSVLLRQATAITGGLYITVKHINEILPSLLSFNLQDSSGAATLSLPLQTNVDFRGSCFCHGKIVDVGYVCSVCLSVFCAFSPFCKVCPYVATLAEAHFRETVQMLTLAWRIKGRSLAKVLAVILGILLVCSGAFANGVVGIDFGTSGVRMGMIRSGKPGIDIVLSFESGRKTTNALAFRDGSPLFNESAMNLFTKFPKMTFVRLASLLGKVFESEAVLEYKKSFVHELGRDPVRGTVLIMDPTENKLVPIEQLVAHMFKHLMDQAAAHAGFQVKDCVISVPAFYNQLERQAVLDAAKIAGFNVLGLINGVSAAAMYQVATLSDIDSAANYIIYDSGAGDTVAAVVRFENGRAVNRVTARAVDIKAVASESGLGGNLIDDRIAAFLIRKYEEAHPGLKVLPGKSYNKVLLEASRLKKILNANDSAMASLEDIVEYESLNFNVIRDDIEGVLNDLAPRFYAPIESVLKSAKLALKDIKAVLMIGGNSRQQYLLKSLRGQVNNEQLLSFTLDPDEAIVRGATLYAAKLHPAFRVLPMHFHDVLTSGLSVHYRNLDGDGSEKSVDLFAPFSPVNSTKSLSLKNMRSAQVELFHSDSQLKIATATLGGFDKVLSELGDKPILASKLKLPVHVNLMGLVHVESASAILEIEEEITKTVPKTKPAADKQAEDAPKPKSPLEQAAEEQDPAAVDAVEEVEIVKEIVKKERTFPLLSEVKFLAVGMSDEQIKGCIRSLEALREKERAKLALANARNDLEKHIFRLETELSRADFVAFSTDKERSQIRKQLNQASSTLNSAQSSSSSADACLKALSELKKLEDPILNRQTESQQRPASLEELSAAISEAQQYAQQTLLEVTADARPQSDAELTALMQRALDASKWLQEKSKKQASLATSANPALLVHEMDERRVVLRKELAELQGRKPLPPTATIDSDAIQENPTATVQQDEPKPGAPNPAEQAAILEDDAQFNKGPNPTPLPKSKEDPIEEFPEEFERDEL